MRRVALALTLGVCWLPTVIDAASIKEAKGAVLRVLDKLSGAVSDYDLASGQSQTVGRLTVRLDDCRYPSDLPSAEAYAHLTISDQEMKDPVFAGWMVASSPALSALDHPRYDVWVLHCDVPAAELAPVAPAQDAPATDSGSGG